MKAAFVKNKVGGGILSLLEIGKWYYVEDHSETHFKVAESMELLSGEKAYQGLQNPGARVQQSSWIEEPTLGRVPMSKNRFSIIPDEDDTLDQGKITFRLL